MFAVLLSASLLASGCSCKGAAPLHPRLCRPRGCWRTASLPHSKTTEPQLLPQVLKPRGNLNHMPSGKDKLKCFAERSHQQVLFMPNSTDKSHSWLHYNFGVFANWNLCCCPHFAGKSRHSDLPDSWSYALPTGLYKKNGGWGASSLALRYHKSSRLQG